MILLCCWFVMLVICNLSVRLKADVHWTLAVWTATFMRPKDCRNNTLQYVVACCRMLREVAKSLDRAKCLRLYSTITYPKVRGITHGYLINPTALVLLNRFNVRVWSCTKLVHRWSFSYQLRLTGLMVPLFDRTISQSYKACMPTVMHEGGRYLRMPVK